METAKLREWQQLLLDTGKRNNLINFKETSVTAEVLTDDVSKFYDRLTETAKIEVFDPNRFGAQEAEELDESADKGGDEPASAQARQEATAREDDARAKYRAKWHPKLKARQELVYSGKGSAVSAVRNIAKRARDYIEDTGVNVAYAAVGFVYWKESENSQIEMRAPVLLVPVEFETGSVTSPVYLNANGDDIITNPTFFYKMKEEYGIRLPAFDETEPAKVYLQKVAEALKPMKWRVTEEVQLGLFSFAKLNMYCDLCDNAERILKNDNVRAMLGLAPAQNTAAAPESSVKNPLLELHNVVDCDSSQMKAVEMVRGEQSFVLQGPPGTGKSQTITNIIAECLAAGKKVLFVSEKLAALTVVHDKLAKVGLEDFCLQIHSQKANKREVIADLYRTLHLAKNRVSDKAELELAALEKSREALDAYAEALHAKRPVIDRSLFELFESYAAFSSVQELDYALPEKELASLDALIETAGLLEEYAAYAKDLGDDYRKAVWAGFSGGNLTYSEKNALKRTFAEALEALKAEAAAQEAAGAATGAAPQSRAQTELWLKAVRTLAASPFASAAFVAPGAADALAKALPPVKADAEALLARQGELFKAWQPALLNEPLEEFRTLLADKCSGFFGRLFNSDWKRISKALETCSRTGASPSYDDAVAVVRRALEVKGAKQAFETKAQSVAALAGNGWQGADTDWARLAQDMTVLDEAAAAGLPLAGLTSGDASFAARLKGAVAAADALEAAHRGAADAFNAVFSHFDQGAEGTAGETLAAVTARLAACLDHWGELDAWLPFAAMLRRGDAHTLRPYLDAALDAGVTPAQLADVYKKRFYRQHIEAALSDNPVLGDFSRITQDKVVETFRTKDRLQFDINRAKIRAVLSRSRPSTDLVAAGSPVSVLVREGEKSRRQMSVRQLFTEIGEVIQTLKPCFLMSPLSVSTYLTDPKIQFDTVVFDEASQIFPQDAVGSIYRGKQLIVVGDSKQMPPSNFFNATQDVRDDEEAGDVRDFESILDLCSSTMRQIRLKWHYRSKYEELIAFSNKHFYDGELVSFPAVTPDRQWCGVDYHYVEGGTINRSNHQNRKEAEYVVDLVYENLKRFPKRSLGVVAFSMSQQKIIEQLLAKRRQSEPLFEKYFSTAVEEPIFVKNLETVQGCERDTIIFSTGYGYDDSGRFSHNFGPLNRDGGERRLNVAVTRAKCNVQLVTSMHATDIDLSKTSQRGAQLLRDYLDYAERGQIALGGAIRVPGTDRFDSDFEEEVAGVLRRAGFTVDSQVGCSGFRIDLAVRTGEGSDYVLAVECDGATYHSCGNARDRDRLRQDQLERMGWTFYRIWSTDWFKNRAVEEKRLIDAVSAALARAKTKAEIAKPSEPVPAEPIPEVKTEPVPAAEAETPAVEMPAEEVPTDAVSEPAAETASAPEPVPAVPAAPVTAKSAEPQNWEEEEEDELERFPEYEAADETECSSSREAIAAICRTEVPVSEEFLMRRLLPFYGKTRLSAVVSRAFDEDMVGCHLTMGVVRHKGFVYATDPARRIVFRRAGDIKREVKYICPEELADGILGLLEANGSAERTGLYRSLLGLCGGSRMTQTATECFDAALETLADKVIIEGDTVRLK